MGQCSLTSVVAIYMGWRGGIMDVLLQHKAIYTKYGSMDELLQGHIYIYYCKSTSAFMCAHSCSAMKTGMLAFIDESPSVS